MANYLLIPCSGDTSFVVDAGAFSIIEGNTYYLTFTGATKPGCYTVNSTSVSPADDTIDTVVDEYNDCFSCFVENNYSYHAQSCDIPGLEGFINANQFNEDPQGKFFTLCSEELFGGCLCVEVIGVNPLPAENTFVVLGPFKDCTCILSANTENFICIPDCEFTGSTSVSPPHPIWINGSGVPVMQTNMVLIGSGNGLNG